MGKQINLSEGKIIEKNKDYSNPQQANEFYERTRLQQLAQILYPEDEYPEGFKETLIKLMKYQNPVQMNVWHNREIILKNGEDLVCTTWDNFCTFQRRFACAEMYQAVEVLRRATPFELWSTSNKELTASDNEILIDFNEISDPKISEMCMKILFVLESIEYQVMEPIRRKINTDLKTMAKMPITSTHEFIKPKQRKM